MLRLGENRLDSSRQRLQIAKASNKAIIFLRILGLFPYKYSRKDFVICRSGIVFQWLTFAILLIVTMFMCYISITLIVFDTLLLKIERLESSILALVAFSLLILQRKRLLSVVNQILHFSSELLDVSLINRGVKLLFLIQLSISLIFLGVLHVTPIGLALYYVETNYLTVSSDLLYAARFIATFMYFNVECFLIYFLVILRACFFAVDSFFASAAMEESNGVDKSTVALRRIVLLRQKLLEMVIEVNVLFSPVLIMSSGFTLSQLLFSSYLGVSYLLAGK